MDYYKKYKKYKSKYIAMKNQTGGDKTFFDRAKGSIIDRQYDILFNLYLVKNNARPSFLLEVANFPKIDPKELFNTIKKIYNEFKYTIENKVDNRIHRVFFHIDPLTKKNNMDHDIWVAENLGFYCKGIPSDDIERVVVNYILFKDNITTYFYTEICSTEYYNKKHFIQKQKLFNKYAKEIGGKVELNIDELIQNESSYYINLLIDGKLGSKYEDKVLGYLWGYGLTGLDNNVVSNKYTFQDLLKDKKLLLFDLVRSIYNPIGQYYPLSSEVASKIEKEEAKIFSDLDKDPINLYKQLESTNIFKKVLNSKPQFKELYNKSYDEMIKFYKKLVKKISN